MTNTRGKGAGNGAVNKGQKEAVMVVACRRSGTKLRKAPVQSWTRARRERFLDALAATANVRMAADAADMGLRDAYRLRERDAAFAGLWEAALEQGYGRLESELLSSALGERRNGGGLKGFLTQPTAATGDSARAFGTLQYLASGAAGDFGANPQERLIDLVQALRGPYRQGASFVMNASTLARIRKFKTSDGAFVWTMYRCRRRG